MTRKTPPPENEIIRHPQRLAEFCAQLRRAGCFGFDTEFIRERSYIPQLCLIQVAVDNEVLLIDPLEIDTREFWSVVADRQVKKVVHAGLQDMEMGYLQAGLAPANLFDVQVAAGLIGMQYPLSHGKLVQGLLEKEVPTCRSFSEWTRRPLSNSQLKYAVSDVLYLADLHRELAKKLAAMNREKWLAEEMAHMEDEEHYAAEPRMAYRRVKGWRRLSPQTLATLREIAAWREAAAEQADVPPRTFLRDPVLRAISSKRPRNVRELANLKHFPKPLARSQGKAILKVLARADRVPKNRWPVPPAREGRCVDKEVIDHLIHVGRALCLKNQLSHDLFASRNDYTELACAVVRDLPSGDLRLMTGWRRQFAADELISEIKRLT